MKPYGQNYLKMKEQLPPHVKLVVVSKQQSLEDILSVYEVGCRDFGENRLEEWMTKKEKLPQDIRWHFIGAIQSKKAKKIPGHFTLVHSVDRFEILEKMEQTGNKTDVLLQANTSGEPAKQGLTPSGWEAVWEKVEKLEHITVQGLMTMAPLSDDLSWIRSTFRELKNLQQRLLAKAYANTPLQELSMGMSSDFPIALEEGATLLRIGSSIFSNVNL